MPPIRSIALRRNRPCVTLHRLSPPLRCNKRPPASSDSALPTQCASHSNSTNQVRLPTCVPTLSTCRVWLSAWPRKKSRRTTARATSRRANTRPRARAHKRPTKPSARLISTSIPSKALPTSAAFTSLSGSAPSHRKWLMHRWNVPMSTSAFRPTASSLWPLARPSFSTVS